MHTRGIGQMQSHGRKNDTTSNVQIWLLLNNKRQRIIARTIERTRLSLQVDKFCVHGHQSFVDDPDHKFGRGAVTV